MGLDLECTPGPSVAGVGFLITDAARRSGLSIDTLRYYERIGLADSPACDAAGRRVYSDDDLVWLGFLTKLRGTGMPIVRMCEYAALGRLGPPEHDGIYTMRPNAVSKQG